MMPSKTQQTILVTGATDGIGLALAHHYRQQSVQLVLIGRRPYKDVPLADFSADSYIQVDLSRPDCAAIIASCLNKLGITRLDCLIHNAGLGYHGQLVNQPRKSINAILAVNLWAPVSLTHKLLPYVRQAQGKIVFISSVVSVLAGPDYSVYTASKAALDGFARNLKIEVANSIQVQVIHPGATRTGMHTKSGMTQNKTDWEQFPSAENVALKIANAISGTKSSVTIGLSNQLLRLSGKYFGRITDSILRQSRPSLASGEWKALSQPQPKSTLDALSNPSTTPEVASNEAAKLCVITGAADGIGRALAKRMAAEGYAIIGVDIDADKAAQTEADLMKDGALISFIIADLTMDMALAQVTSQLVAGPPIDMLIHNAGINAVGRFAELSLEAQKAVYQLNLLAPLHMTTDLLKYGKLMPTSKMIFISSLSHFIGYPGAAVYAACKDGIASFGRSLSVDLVARNIHTLTVFPGPTRTAHARRYSPDNTNENNRMSPEDLANQIFDAVQHRRQILIPGFKNQIFAKIGSISPSVAEATMKKMILEKLE